jgi:hypothetical protein
MPSQDEIDAALTVLDDMRVVNPSYHEEIVEAVLKAAEQVRNDELLRIIRRLVDEFTNTFPDGGDAFICSILYSSKTCLRDAKEALAKYAINNK